MRKKNPVRPGIQYASCRTAINCFIPVVRENPKTCQRTEPAIEPQGTFYKGAEHHYAAQSNWIVNFSSSFFLLYKIWSRKK